MLRALPPARRACVPPNAGSIKAKAKLARRSQRRQARCPRRAVSRDCHHDATRHDEHNLSLPPELTGASQGRRPGDVVTVALERRASIFGSLSRKTQAPNADGPSSDHHGRCRKRHTSDADHPPTKKGALAHASKQTSKLHKPASSASQRRLSQRVKTR